MIKRILHIGIAVRDLEASSDLFTRLLGRTPERTEIVDRENAAISFFPVGESDLELIKPVPSPGRESSLSKFLDKRGEGIHHLCLEVDDLAAEMARLKKAGFQFVNDEPSPGGGGSLVAFIHPKSANGVLIELSQPKPASGRGE